MKKLILFLTAFMATVASAALLDVKVPQQALASPPTWTDRVVPFESAISTTLTSYRSGMGLGTEDSPTFTGLTLSGLTAGRVTLASTAGLLADDADLTFSGTRLTSTDLTVTNFPTFTAGTATRVPFFGVAGVVTDDSDMTFATDTLTVTKGTFGGITHVANAIASANSLTSVALSPLTLGTGTFGTAVSFASATGIGTFTAAPSAPSYASTVATGTAPFTVASTTLVSNLHAAEADAVPASGLTGTTLAANVVTSSLTTVGALNAGSITPGFGSIDVGADSITGGVITGTTVASTGSLKTTGSSNVAAANTAFMDYVSGTTGRFTIYGPDAATPGAFQIVGLSSNASAGDIRFSISNAGAVSTNGGSITGGAISGTTGTFTGAMNFSPTSGNVSVNETIPTSADRGAITFKNQIGDRQLEIAYWGSTAASAYGWAANESGINTQTALTISVADSAVAKFTSTGLNNTVIGATTPAAISGTTGTFSGQLTTATTVSSSGSNALRLQAPTNTSVTIGVDGGSQFVVGGYSPATLSQGLAVTGTLSATGAISGTQDTSLSSGTAYLNASDPSLRFNGTANTANKRVYDIEAAGDALRFRSFDDALSAATVMATVSSTGLAVTGTLSATGKASVNSPSNTSGAISAAFNNAGGNIGLLLISSDNQSNTSYAVFTNSAVVTCGSITRVTTTDAVAYNTTSDGRLKTNVRDFTGADSGKLIDGLRPRWFDWKASDLQETVEETFDTGKKDKDGKAITEKRSKLQKVTDPKRLADHVANNKSIIGFIAQEEAAVDPALVRIGAVTPGDNDPTTITKQWARSDAALVPVLVAEVKSLRKRVAALEADKLAQEKRMAGIEARLAKLEAAP